MVPAQPPLPTAWNLPFHAWAGSQTSILMSESDEGVSVAATRQKVGSWLNCGTAGPVSGRVMLPSHCRRRKNTQRRDRPCLQYDRDGSLQPNSFLRRRWSAPLEDRPIHFQRVDHRHYVFAEPFSRSLCG